MEECRCVASCRTFVACPSGRLFLAESAESPNERSADARTRYDRL